MGGEPAPPQPRPLLGLTGRTALLHGVAVCYLLAFGSLALQAPGLYGPGGVAPAEHVLRRARATASGGAEATLAARMSTLPTLLWLKPDTIDASSALQLLLWAGCTLAAWAVLRPSAPLFVACFALYSSTLPVGDVFLHFQWDILLLEAGFVCVLAAPWTVPWRSHRSDAQGNDTSASMSPLPVWLARLLLFKLMLLSGVVKLDAGCPTWLNLTATTYHFATQCIPTPLARIAHEVPLFLHKFFVASTLFLEGPAAFVLVVPHAGLRAVGAWAQVFLQCTIIATGNYNFFNLLTIVLALSTIDGDEERAPARQWPPRGTPLRRARDMLVWSIAAALLMLSAGWMFDLRAGGDTGAIETRDASAWNIELRMSVHQMHAALRAWLPRTLGLLWLAVFPGVEARRLAHRWRAELLNASPGRAVLACAQSMSALIVAWLLFTASAWPLLHGSLQGGFPQWALPPLPIDGNAVAFAKAHHLTSSYGLFRRMTGVGRDGGVARPEVVFEVSSDGRKFAELEFLFKPGRVDRPPPWVAPHQPRLDWQMWFAALGSYNHNGWLVSLAYRILEGSPEVYRLLDELANNGIASPRAPPKVLRASLWHYDFAPSGSGVWWERTRVEGYLPELSLDNPSLQAFARDNGLTGGSKTRCSAEPLCALAATPPAMGIAISAATGFAAALVCHTLRDISPVGFVARHLKSE